MTGFQFDNIRIAGIASAVPSKTVKSEEYYAAFGESAVRKTVETTGVESRHITSEYQTASDLGFAAAENLLNGKQIDRDSIGVLIFGGHCGDYRKPATAAVLHKRLGLRLECAAFDVGLGCSAFVYCIQIGAAMLNASSFSRALVIVSETTSKMVYPEDRSLEMIVGDGGSAILLERTAYSSSISGRLYTDGSGYRAIIVPAGGFRNQNAGNEPIVWRDGNPRTPYNTYMDGMEVFNFTLTKVPQSIRAFLDESGQTIDQFDCLAFHQANKLILQQLARKLKVDFSRVPYCLDRYGNIGGATIPLLLSDKYGDIKEKQDLRVLCCGFGVGLSWGILTATINTEDILPIQETDEVFSEGIINTPEDLTKG